MHFARVLTLAVLASPLLAGCTTSDVVMTGHARSPVSPESIRMYLRAPAKFESIGLVTATSNATPFRSKNKQSALTELKAKAAAVGANGVLLLQDDGSTGSAGTVFVPTGGSVGIVSGGRTPAVEVKGEAIFVTAP